MKLSAVASWHDALNAEDVERLLDLSDPEVAIHGPRGAARGHDVLEAWARSAGLHLTPERWFCGAGDAVVVAQRATWPDGAARTPAIGVATAFGVRDGRIASVARFEALEEALGAAGPTPADEVRA